MNRVDLAGYLGNDPELNHTKAGKAVCNLRVATQEPGGSVWHDVVLWGQTAEFMAEHAKKGQFVWSCGRINYRVYTNKDGQEAKTVEIMAYSAGIGSRKDTRQDNNDEWEQ